MICWSCQKEMSPEAMRCPHCEVKVEEAPTEEEMSAVLGLIEGMGSELIDEIRSVAESSENGEEFVNRLLIGDCPSCGSSKTGDCDNDPDIDDICVARCFSCGQLWCPDCGELFQGKAAPEHDCPAWKDMDLDDLELDDGELD